MFLFESAISFLFLVFFGGFFLGGGGELQIMHITGKQA